MNSPLRVELFQIGEHDYTVIVGDFIGHSLTRDEALGAIAQALYSPGVPCPYLRLIAGRATHYGSQPR